jgi:hypothetical protein
MAILQIEDLSIEVSKKKLNSNILFPEPKPYKPLKQFDEKTKVIDPADVVALTRRRTYIMRTDGSVLGTTKEVSYKDEWVDNEGKVADIILWLLEKDGKLMPSKLYQATKVITGILAISRNIVENWIPESVYEIYISRKKYNEAEYGRMQALLFKKAEEWYANDKAALGQFVFREGGRAYAMLLFPYIRKEANTCKFCFVMACSRTKQEYQNLMEFSTALTPPTVLLAEEPNNEELLRAIAQ